ncbi:hypothetical protein [Sphingomonas sp. TZW2008]|uniref:hypothetical protein n=1 Tax=Sphingomonas sp. TZW2008 TaxID=1917973 RepID=UPI000A2725AA|nr:hypothetical protein [Sphingomonas sp. TZW2008]
MRTGADEAAVPKYAHIERERRWLIDPSRLPTLPADHVLIEDRYLAGTRMRLRRMTDSGGGGAALKLTKKYEADDPLARAIVTAYLDEPEYALLAGLPGATIVKRRHALVSGGLTYSVDRFEGALAGLILAEIEWADDAGLRGLPAPSGAIREVSDDPRYQGGGLVVHGIPKED